MALAWSDSHPAMGRSKILERLSLPRQLAWGYLGLLLFMIGDGVEAGYLAPFLTGTGMSEGKIAFMFTLYGMAAVFAARMSGPLSDWLGSRMVMWIGLAIWAGLEIVFLVVGIRMGNREILVFSYALRGFGYPLFAYGFLVCIAFVTPPQRLSSAVGWFWFAFTGGLPTLGSLSASFAIPVLGQYTTFWVSLIFVVMGGLIMLFGIPPTVGIKRQRKSVKPTHKTLFSGVTIAWEKPRVFVGCIVRMINTAPQFGFLIFLPSFFISTVGFSLSQWLRLLSYMFLSNIIWNLVFGILGDRLGWRRTVAYVGGLGCAASTLLLYYLPLEFPGNYLIAVAAAMLFGATLAGFVPLSAIMPMLAPENPGAAISMLNLGAGASAWLGPALVGLFLKPAGVKGMMWIFAILYALSAVMTLFLKIPGEAKLHADAREKSGLSGFAFASSGCLLGHPPLMSKLPGNSSIKLILFDLGGTIYDDETFTRALLRAALELNPKLSEHDFWEVYDEQRGRSSGSLRTVIAERFVPGGDRKALTALAKSFWEYPESALYPDVRPALRSLATNFRLGLVANAGRSAEKALRRDGLYELFDVVVLSEFEGVEKPNEAIFHRALEKAGVAAAEAIHVGNRLDNDVRPAKCAGLKTIWMLRGDAPPAPTLTQLSEPDAIIITLNGLGTALTRVVNVQPEATAAKERVEAPAGA
jgi:polyol permease family/HAD superfamily hydrolase (TIGR01549 family)